MKWDRIFTHPSVPTIHRWLECNWQYGRKFWQTVENTKSTGNSIQHIFKSLQHFQRSGSRKVCFSLQRKGSFQTMYCQEMQMFQHENIQTVQLHWLHLQHQSVLEEGQTMPSPTADSSTCHSDITACSSKGKSSQTAYEEFLLFPSPIWRPDKEKDLLLKDCNYQNVRACHRALDTRKLNWMGWPLRKCQEWPDGNIVEGEERHSCCTSRR